MDVGRRFSPRSALRPTGVTRFSQLRVPLTDPVPAMTSDRRGIGDR